ncbi:MAG: hypothetical protein M5R42_20100 [Rhodocyclaceae bacterium]|nr:hypothetical protein [Rhodocyclaceae bacterium]
MLKRNDAASRPQLFYLVDLRGEFMKAAFICRRPAPRHRAHSQLHVPAILWLPGSGYDEVDIVLIQSQLPG